jgi:hypothetical protein
MSNDITSGDSEAYFDALKDSLADATWQDFHRNLNTPSPASADSGELANDAFWAKERGLSPASYPDPVNTFDSGSGKPGATAAFWVDPWANAAGNYAARHPVSYAFAPDTVVVKPGDTLIGITQEHYAGTALADRAGVALILAENSGIEINGNGSPVIRQGEKITLPSPLTVGNARLAQLDKSGGAVIANNTQGQALAQARASADHQAEKDSANAKLHAMAEGYPKNPVGNVDLTSASFAQSMSTPTNETRAITDNSFESASKGGTAPPLRFRVGLGGKIQANPEHPDTPNIIGPVLPKPAGEMGFGYVNDLLSGAKSLVDGVITTREQQGLAIGGPIGDMYAAGARLDRKLLHFVMPNNAFELAVLPLGFIGKAGKPVSIAAKELGVLRAEVSINGGRVVLGTPETLTGAYTNKLPYMESRVTEDGMLLVHEAISDSQEVFTRLLRASAEEHVAAGVKIKGVHFEAYGPSWLTQHHTSLIRNFTNEQTYKSFDYVAKNSPAKLADYITNSWWGDAAYSVLKSVDQTIVNNAQDAGHFSASFLTRSAP